MPNIDKVKKTKTKKKPTKKTTNLPVVTKKTKPTAKDVVAYFNCLLNQAQAGWVDPQTGTKKKITACCKECKAKAPNLSIQRNQEIQKLIVSYQQVGDSLKKLLQPIK